MFKLLFDRRSKLALGTADQQVAFLREILPGVEVEADDYLVHNAWRAELRWHPTMIDRQVVHGIEHLERAVATGRGVVVSFVHHGPYDEPSSVARARVPLHVVAGSAVTAADAAPFLRQHRRIIGSAGNVVVEASAGSAALGALLDAGSCVALAIDVPGRSVMQVGSAVLVGSSGAARLAVRHDALVVALTCVGAPVVRTRCTWEGRTTRTT